MEPGLRLESWSFFMTGSRVVHVEMMKMYDWIVGSTRTRQSLPLAPYKPPTIELDGVGQWSQALNPQIHCRCQSYTVGQRASTRPMSGESMDGRAVWCLKDMYIHIFIPLMNENTFILIL